MALKKLPNNQSTDELLELLATDSFSKTQTQHSDDILLFISNFNISNGEECVLKSTLYHLYKNWSSFPKSKNGFGLEMGKYFLTHQKGSKTYYLINLSALSIQTETIKFIENKRIDKTKYPSWQKHYNDFLNFYKIYKGTSWVPSYVLMHFYDKWCYNNRRKRLLSELQFFNFCKLHFKYKRNTDSRMMWFGVNKEFLEINLSPKKLLQMQQIREKKNVKKQKINNKIPGFKTGTKPKN